MFRSRLVNTGIAIVAASVMLVLTLQGHSLSAQQPQYTIRHSIDPVTADPVAAVWNDLPSLDVPLIPQGGVSPALFTASVSSVSVQAIHDGEQVAFRMVWDDETRDVEAGRPDVFRDSAAIQFPVGDVVPSICMGAAGQLSNIWHWKSDWQEDLDTGFQDLTRLYPNFFKDYYPYAEGTPPFDFPTDFNNPSALSYSPGRAVGNSMSQALRATPVENLVAIGFGTLTTHEHAEIDGQGVWEDGRWSVVFIRDLAAPTEDLTAFTPGGEVTTAFAVWNGSNEEVGARKQLSGFVTFGLESPAEPVAAPAIVVPAEKRGNTLTLIIVLVGAWIAVVAAAAIVLGRDTSPSGRGGRLR
jgi:hypothetical protein